MSENTTNPEIKPKRHDELLSQAYSENGAFFAFSKDQFDQSKVEGVKYVSLFSGLVCPKENAKQLLAKLNQLHDEKVRSDIAENGLSSIIQRELANYECQITCDYSDALDALQSYGVTEEMIKPEYAKFMDHCIENDLF